MIRAIVTDIEGTTSSISFVHDVLFPYARAHMREFVCSHASDPQVQLQLDEVRRLMGGTPDLDSISAQLLAWIDEDKKVTPLKAIQGLIWEQGYYDGDFQGHIYSDAVENLKKWHAQGILLYVYSSGSVQAQKLLFSHTSYGDLTSLFTAYFDTHIGPKIQPSSYHHIIEALALAPEQILFLSDVPLELDAAKANGIKTCCLLRDSQARTDVRHSAVHDFNEIDLAVLGA